MKEEDEKMFESIRAWYRSIPRDVRRKMILEALEKSKYLAQAAEPMKTPEYDFNLLHRKFTI